MVSILGKGRFSTVEKVTMDSKMVALKVISHEAHSEFRRTSGTRNEVADEVWYLRLITHAHVVSYIDVKLEAHETQIFMEYMAGGDLMHALVFHGALEHSIACKLFVELTQGLQYLHENGIVHRDIKPENVLLSSTPSMSSVAKFCDFGLARSVMHGDYCRTLCGTFFLHGARVDFANMAIWAQES